MCSRAAAYQSDGGLQCLLKDVAVLSLLLILLMLPPRPARKRRELELAVQLSLHTELVSSRNFSWSVPEIAPVCSPSDTTFLLLTF